MIYIMAYRLCRKNARRKVYVKLQCEGEFEAVRQFDFYCRERLKVDSKPKEWELLTGDWKHITFFCNKCKCVMDERCMMCSDYKKGNEENGKS
ncbi:MAG: hypothetical protein J6S67_14760 [Methanobrevibacter sp.]|nr:hypothetical protein [Methanobrevibacter sp.]